MKALSMEVKRGEIGHVDLTWEERQPSSVVWVLSRRAEVGKYQAFHLFAVDNSPRPHLPITSLLHTA